MTGEQIEIRTIFNKNTVKFKVVDLTPWPSLVQDGVTPVLMTITGVGPTGVAFPAATVNIDYTQSNFEESTGWFQLPKTNGAISPGGYVFTAEVEVDYNIVNATINQIASAAIFVPGNYSFMEAGESLTISGATAPGDNGSATIVSAQYIEDQDVTVIFLAKSFTGQFGGSAVFSYIENGKLIENSFSYTYSECNEVEVAITSAVDCSANNGAGSLVVTDATTIPNGQSVLNGSNGNTTKRIALSYPVGLIPEPTTNPKTTFNSVLGISPIADTVGNSFPFVAVVTLDMQAIQDDGLYIWYTAKGQESIAVVCGTNLCAYENCINNYITAYDAQLKKGIEQPANMAQVVLMNSYIQQYMIAKACANYTAMTTALSNLELLMGDECGCGQITNSAPAWLQDTDGNVFQPDWQFNAYVPIWRNSEIFNDTNAELMAQAEAIVVGKNLLANVGDQVNIYIEGTNVSGSGSVVVQNETTGVTYLNTGSMPSGTTFWFQIQITRVDGDLVSWLYSRKTVNSAGTTQTYTFNSSPNVNDTDYDLNSDNILNIAPTNDHVTYTIAKVYVERQTNQPE